YLKERSSIAVIGLSVHTAPVEMREKLAVPEAQWPRQSAARVDAIREEMKDVEIIYRSFSQMLTSSAAADIGDDALTKKLRKAVDELSGGIVNKLLHGPLQHLRCDGTDGRT
ncbi:hypothetical protein BHE74_00053955, partial [Ensete ventricosum]